MQKKMTGNEFRTTVVCIDSCESLVLRGRIYNPSRAGAIAFDSTLQFLLQTEDLLDSMNFPQPFTAKREFAPAQPPPAAPASGEKQTGALATFAVRILFRQNASWQGSVAWLESGREESFRSALELLMLMHSALTAKKT